MTKVVKSSLSEQMYVWEQTVEMGHATRVRSAPIRVVQALDHAQMGSEFAAHL